MLRSRRTFLCASFLCFSLVCIVADDRKQEASEDSSQVVLSAGEKQEGEELSLADRSAQVIREQDAEEGGVNRWREQDLGEDAESSGSQGNAFCLSLLPPNNGFIVGSDFREGAKVRVLCEEGYVSAGPSELTCIACVSCGHGIWSPGEEYSCKPRNPSLVEIHLLKAGEKAHPVYSVQESSRDACPAPEAPEHGYLQGSDYSVGASVRIFCYHGYALVGPDRITCLPVPDPFKDVFAWQPMEMPTCRNLPLSLLPTRVSPGTSHRHGMSSHRLTDTSPGPIHAEHLPHICFLPKVVGPCEMVLPRFYFNSSVRECQPFIYGGCMGNENNFVSMEGCQRECR